MRWKTTSLIGGTCTGRDVFSESVLMHEGLINLHDCLVRVESSNPFQFLVYQAVRRVQSTAVSIEKVNETKQSKRNSRNETIEQINRCKESFCW